MNFNTNCNSDWDEEWESIQEIADSDTYEHIKGKLRTCNLFMMCQIEIEKEQNALKLEAKEMIVKEILRRFYKEQDFFEGIMKDETLYQILLGLWNTYHDDPKHKSILTKPTKATKNHDDSGFSEDSDTSLNFQISPKETAKKLPRKYVQAGLKKKTYIPIYKHNL